MSAYTIRNGDTIKDLKSVSKKTGIKKLLEVINFLINYYNKGGKIE